MIEYYEVKYATIFGFGPENFGGPSHIIVVPPPDGILPTDKKELVVLHTRHAHMSFPMAWEDDSGTLMCVHCRSKLNVSNSTFGEILNALSKGVRGVFQSDQLVVTVAQFLKEFPSDADDLPLGCYVVKRVKPGS